MIAKTDKGSYRPSILDSTFPLTSSFNRDSNFSKTQGHVFPIECSLTNDIRNEKHGAESMDTNYIIIIIIGAQNIDFFC